MTDGSHISMRDTHAPAGQYRVVCWRIREGRAYESFIDGDFADRKVAKRRAKELALPDLLWAAVYDCLGRVRHSCSPTAKADLTHPMAVTRLAGFTDPLRRAQRRPYSRRS